MRHTFDGIENRLCLVSHPLDLGGQTLLRCRQDDVASEGYRQVLGNGVYRLLSVSIDGYISHRLAAARYGRQTSIQVRRRFYDLALLKLDSGLVQNVYWMILLYILECHALYFLGFKKNKRVSPTHGELPRIYDFMPLRSGCGRYGITGMLQLRCKDTACHHEILGS